MKRCGYTLAEVLITLCIIGVVMAMTIPTLLNQNPVTKQIVTPISTHHVDTEIYNVGY